MSLSIEDNATICAISTPPGCGGIAVVRISGEDAIAVADKIWRGKPLASCASHTAHLGTVVDSEGRPLDTCVATVFRAPRSFTGENIVEFAIHGSLFVQQAILESITGCGARVAEPGEFTRRAFMNGRLDLVEAEAVADLIAASSQAAHSLAISQLQGKFSEHIKGINEKLIELAALLELELDFSEEDVVFADRTKLRKLAEDVVVTIGKMAATFSSGEALRNGVGVAIIGRPNSGKSSLLNVLVGSERAIVSDIAGTTRDTVEESVDINGVTFRFIDTAGLRHTSDPIEKLGIERSYASLSRAKIVLWLLESELTKEELSETWTELKSHINENSTLIPVISKADINTKIEKQHITDVTGINTVLNVSALTCLGIDTLRGTLYEKATQDIPADESMVVTNARHYSSLLKARQALLHLIEGLDATSSQNTDAYLTTDLLAEHLREAISSLNSITGAITSDTILTTIFSRFCIGK